MLVINYIEILVFGQFCLVIQLANGVEKSCQCGKPVASSKIIEGNEATPHSIPHQVGMTFNNQTICGGSLISPNFVLTSAHCIGNFWQNLKVIVGDHNTAVPDGEMFYFIKRIFVHPQYRIFPNKIVGDWTVYDFALLQLDIQVRISESVGVVCLPPDTQDKFEGEALITSGWGKTKVDNETSISNVLRMTRLQVFSNKGCLQTYYKFQVNYDYKVHICAANKKETTGMCNGDSGGPMTVMVNNRVILAGVVSFGNDNGCGLTEFPGVGARVSSVKDWILDNTDAAEWQC